MDAVRREAVRSELDRIRQRRADAGVDTLELLQTWRQYLREFEEEVARQTPPTARAEQIRALAGAALTTNLLLLEHRLDLDDLRSEVADLRAEVAELRAALEASEAVLADCPQPGRPGAAMPP